MARRGRRRWPPLARGTELGLSDPFRAWVLENAADGVAPGELVSALVEGGVPRPIAAREVAGLVISPHLAALRRERRGRIRAEQVLALLKELEPSEIERRPTPRADEFYSRYFHENRPVIFTDFTAGWPARDWTPELLALRMGDAEVGVVQGRDAHPEDYDERTRQLEVTMKLRDYVALIRERSPTNDLYSVANNRNMEREAFKSLLEDIRIDEAWIDRRLLAGGTSFWLGPEGTVTPLHHDTTNILFCQLHGRKRFVLASPFESALLGAARGFYARISPDSPDFAARRHDVVLAPGETLFLPVGWWHEVRSLDVSISFSLLALRKKNRFEGYGPGHVG